MDKTPFEILGKGDRAYQIRPFVEGMGIQNLSYTLEALGVMSAVIVILLSLIALLIVNYPKTVAQTKQRVAHAIIAVMFIVLSPLLMDIVYNTFLTAFYGS